MEFNWDNPQHIIGNWPVLGGGEFVGRCLTLHQSMSWPAYQTHLNELLSDVSYQRRYEILTEYKPTDQMGIKQWHRWFPSSGAWLDFSTDRYSIVYEPGNPNYRFENWESDLWVDCDLAGTKYFNRFWKPDAIRASQTHGLFVKSHSAAQFLGLAKLFPAAKKFKLVNCRKWQDICFKAGKVVDTQLIEDLGYQGNDIELFEFDMYALISDETSFYTQMNKAYDYFFPGSQFSEVAPYLLEFRRVYIKWHISF
jgi:hypothetical protein